MIRPNAIPYLPGSERTQRLLLAHCLWQLFREESQLLGLLTPALFERFCPVVAHILEEDPSAMRYISLANSTWISLGRTDLRSPLVSNVCSARSLLSTRPGGNVSSLSCLSIAQSSNSERESILALLARAHREQFGRPAPLFEVQGYQDY